MQTFAELLAIIDGEIAFVAAGCRRLDRIIRATLKWVAHFAAWLDAGPR
ncbi:hypothetical protein [Cupriavidus necator]